MRLLTLKVKLLLSLLVVLTSFSIIKAQDSSPADLKGLEQFNKVQEQLPRESIYLHTDRNWYYPGERIWFSAYSLAGGFLKLSSISKVLYVELIAPSGNIIKREVVNISKGRAEGSISISDIDGTTGNFMLKAYTKWGNNFGSSYEFNKKISILSTDETEFPETDKEDIDIQFFPESGHMIHGIPTNLAFKAISTDGFGKSVKGTIIDEKGNKVHSFESDYLGMGVVKNFIPKASKNYTAIVHNKRFKLPEIKSSGASFSISSQDEFYKVALNTSQEFYNQSLLLFAHVRGKIYYANKLNINELGNTEIIAKNHFPTGIVHFSLLNNQGFPIAERLAFSRNKVDSVKVEVDLKKNDYSHRDRVQLDINVKNIQNNPINGTSSISVFDDRIVEYDSSRQNITSHFFLGTQIKGHVENPGFYFSDHKNADYYLDLLLLTQGWKAYEINLDTLSKDLKNYKSPEKGISISGSVNTLISDKPLKESVVFLSMGENDDAQIITTDDEGRFTAEGLNFYGIKNAEVKANKKGGSDRVWIRLDDQFSELPSERSKVSQRPQARLFTSINDSQKNEDSLEDRFQKATKNAEEFVEAQLKGDLGEFTVTANEDNANNSTSLTTGEVSGLGTFIDSKRLQENYKHLSLPMILNQIPGVKYNFSSHQVSVRTSFTNFSGSTTGTLLLVDGMETDLTFIRSLTTDIIKSITVTRSAIDNAIYGARGTGGVISIETKTGNFRSAMDSRGYKISAIQGYQSPTSFYTPKYGVNLPKDHPKVDNRITVHWDSDVTLNDGHSNVIFWTNDVSSKYRVVIEGITESGIPFYKTTTFEVSN